MNLSITMFFFSKLCFILNCCICQLILLHNSILLIIPLKCLFSVVKDFLRLTRDFMDKGPNSNLYNKAAGIIYFVDNFR